jgi:PPOX class probable F420-dependent enzyme
MATLNDPEVRALLDPANCAVISTLNEDGSITSSVVWISLEEGELAVNGTTTRRWAANLERRPGITLVVFPAGDPYEYVEIRGVAAGSRTDADAHADRLAQKYLGVERFTGGRPGEVRLKYVISPAVVRYEKQT